MDGLELEMCTARQSSVSVCYTLCNSFFKDVSHLNIALICSIISNLTIFWHQLSNWASNSLHLIDVIISTPFFFFYHMNPDELCNCTWNNWKSLQNPKKIKKLVFKNICILKNIYGALKYCPKKLLERMYLKLHEKVVHPLLWKPVASFYLRVWDLALECLWEVFLSFLPSVDWLELGPDGWGWISWHSSSGKLTKKQDQLKPLWIIDKQASISSLWLTVTRNQLASRICIWLLYHSNKLH